jgi:hypothetical protein
VDLQRKNEALLLKHLHKFYNKEDTPWVKLVWNHYEQEVPHAAKPCGSFWWRDIVRLSDQYREICSISLGQGDTTLFWSDKWRQDTLQSKFPRLFSFALDKNIYVKKVLQTEDISELFYLPLSTQAFEEFNHVETILENINPSGQDSWKTIWKDGIYTANKFYHYTFRDQVASPIYSWIWKSRCTLSIKVLHGC